MTESIYIVMQQTESSGECRACGVGPGITELQIYVGVEVVTLEVMKSSTFWDITPFSPLKFNRYFGGI
jgi:hypothetical protein